MIAVHFDKQYAELFIDAIQNGKPIPPMDGVNWTGNNMLTLAGMLYASVFSQGPHTHQLAGITAAQRNKMPEEHREAVESTFNTDIHDAIDFVTMLTFKVMDKQFDDQFHPSVAALVFTKAEGGKGCIPHKGFKEFPNGAAIAE
jgi:hypothetical protein